MMTSRKISFLAAVALVAAACSTYKASPELNYYHGPNVPPGYITVLRASPTEIEFEVRIKFVKKQMYHLVLDGNAPVAEGWFSTLRAGGERYTVTMRTKGGLTFEAGKTYRLCIGDQNPQAVQMTSRNYRCVADLTFVFKEKA